MTFPREQGRLDSWVFSIDLASVPWLKPPKRNEQGQVELPSTPSESDWTEMIELTLDPGRQLTSQVVVLPEKVVVNAGLFFGYMDEKVFQTGPTHPQWDSQCLLALSELDAKARLEPMAAAVDGMYFSRTGG